MRDVAAVADSLGARTLRANDFLLSSEILYNLNEEI